MEGAGEAQQGPRDCQWDLDIMSYQTDPVPGPLPDRDLAVSCPLEQQGTGHCHMGSLECHSSWKLPPEAYQKPPPERPHMVVSQKIYVNSQTAMKSL